MRILHVDQICLGAAVALGSVNQGPDNFPGTGDDVAASPVEIEVASGSFGDLDRVDPYSRGRFAFEFQVSSFLTADA